MTKVQYTEEQRMRRKLQWSDWSRRNKWRLKEKKHKYYLENKEKFCEMARKWRQDRCGQPQSIQTPATKMQRRFYHQKHFHKRRLSTLNAYGGRCVCCGESKFQFLAFDHPNGKGREHYKQIGGSKGLATWAMKNNYPDIIRVLCHNCNMSIGFYGYCPHQAIASLVGDNLLERV